MDIAGLHRRSRIQLLLIRIQTVRRMPLNGRTRQTGSHRNASLCQPHRRRRRWLHGLVRLSRWRCTGYDADTALEEDLSRDPSAILIRRRNARSICEPVNHYTGPHSVPEWNERQVHPLCNKSGPTQPTFRLPLFICAKCVFQVSHNGPRGLKLSELVAMETWKCVLRVRHAQLARRTRVASRAFRTTVRVHWLRGGGAGVLVFLEKCTEVLRNPGTFRMPYEQRQPYICGVVDRPERGLLM